MTDQCDNCLFFTGLDGPYGVCRNRPPVPVLVMGEGFHPGDTLQGYWPRVGRDDWCGSWSADAAEQKLRYARSMQGDF